MSLTSSSDLLCRVRELKVHARASGASSQGERTILGPINLDLFCGECLLISGPNGSGKTTLVRALLDLFPEDGRLVRSGEIAWAGNLKPAVVLQDPAAQAIMPTVADEVAFVLENKCVAADTIPTSVREVLRTVGLAGMEHRLVRTLSGGELQRLSIACALAATPEILVLDEPFSQLDAESALELLRTLERLTKTDASFTTLLVEHREGAWHSLANRELALPSGRVITVDRTEDRPAVSGVVAAASLAETPGVSAVGQRGTLPGEGGSPVRRNRADSSVCAQQLVIGHPGRSSENSALRASTLSEPADEGAVTGIVRSGINLKLNRGEATVLVGSNGSGKSTLLWTLAGVLPPFDGELCVAGLDLRRPAARRRLHRRGRVRLVPQDAEAAFLTNTLRAELDSIGCPLDAVADVLAEAGLNTRLSDAPATLSMGQMRFFSVIAACGAAPEVLLLDEPTVALDRSLVPVVTRAVHTVLAAGTAVVIATHDQELLANETLFSTVLPIG